MTNPLCFMLIRDDVQILSALPCAIRPPEQFSAIEKGLFDNRIDPFTDAIAIPECGLLLERRGTILSRISMQLMTAVIKLERPQIHPNYDSYKGCMSMFDVVIRNFNGG